MSPQTVAIAFADHSFEPLFDEAIDAIQNTISEKDRKAFRHYADINSMLTDLRSPCAFDQKEHQRLRSCTKKIALFSHAFAPYFDLIDASVHVRSDWLGWFWGMIALVFKKGSNYLLFLEKSVDLFDTIARGLPQYQTLQESLQEYGQAARHDRLALMSHMYADIVRLCLELYCMFSRSQGAKLRHRFGFSSAAWRPLDSRFAQLQQRLVRHRQWLEAELESNEEALVHHRREYISILQPLAPAGEEVILESERMARRMRRVDRVNAWLSNCCDYRDMYEHKIPQRHPKSGSWFLKTPAYCKWKNAPFNEKVANSTDVLAERWHENILFVQAKPGFGKTFISGQVIDDLIADAEDLNIGDEPPKVAFFHFNAAHMYCTHPNDAFRALAAQVVHTHRHDRSSLDALSLTMRKTSAQEMASSDDVLSVLSLLLRQHPTFLVIDGVDECSDIELFLTLLPDICRKTDARVILFSRPQIQIPLSYQVWATDSPHILFLDKNHNSADIDSYITENLSKMADQGYFGISMDRSLIQKVAQQSDGMFLWASLLLKYLQSPTLTPQERYTALDQIHGLAGLESLYNGIFSVLERRVQSDRDLAANVFRWLSLSIRRKCLPGFQIALGLVPGRSSTEDLSSLDFAEYMPQLTCGLVEVTGCSILFAHQSVKEYLQSSVCQSSVFSLFDEHIVHGHLTARCLTFLTEDISKQPLQRLTPYIRPAPPVATSSGVSVRTGSSRDSGYKSMSSSSDTDGVNTEPTQPPQTPPFDADIPFLRYSSLCWPIHLTRALSQNSSHFHPLKSRIQPTAPFANFPWLPALSDFLADRLAITTWVEASLRYSLPPNLSRIVPLLSALKAEIPPATVEGRKIRSVVSGLRELSDELNELREEYGATLRDNPSLIWQWSGHVSSSGGGDGSEGFWPRWDERNGRVFGSEEDAL